MPLTKKSIEPDQGNTHNEDMDSPNVAIARIEETLVHQGVSITKGFERVEHQLLTMAGEVREHTRRFDVMDAVALMPAKSTQSSVKNPTVTIVAIICFALVLSLAIARNPNAIDKIPNITVPSLAK